MVATSEQALGDRCARIQNKDYPSCFLMTFVRDNACAIEPASCGCISFSLQSLGSVPRPRHHMDGMLRHSPYGLQAF